MSVKFFNEDVPAPKIRRRNISAWVKETVSKENKILGDINFIFCSDSYLLDVNRKYLNHDYFTDIITFDYVENNIISGDIYISIDRVRENSKLYKESMMEELRRIFIHGVLHLLGYKDKAVQEKEEMTKKEDYYLKLFKDMYLI